MSIVRIDLGEVVLQGRYKMKAIRRPQKNGVGQNGESMRSCIGDGFVEGEPRPETTDIIVPELLENRHEFSARPLGFA